MAQRVRKAVLPVAGLGTRFLPATKAMAKEMLPVVDKPLIQYAIEEARAAGIDQFCMVTGRGKTALAERLASRLDAATAAGCAPDVDHYGEHVVDWTQHLGDPEHPNPTIHAAFGYAAQMVVADRASGDIERVLAVHDVGRAVNPLLCEGQIEGSVHMGLGYALTEQFPHDPETGFPVNTTLRSLGILRAKDVPQIDVQLVEVPQPRSLYGIKGVGEIGLVPTAGAVAAALHAADGVWRHSLPRKPANADETD